MRLEVGVYVYVYRGVWFEHLPTYYTMQITYPFY